MSKIGQKERVLNYMLDNGGITTWEAIKEFGITRLSDCIFRLRKRGYFIDNEWIETTNRYGDSVRYVKYTVDIERTFNFMAKKPLELMLPEGAKIMAEFKLKCNSGINTPATQEKAEN